MERQCCTGGLGLSWVFYCICPYSTRETDLWNAHLQTEEPPEIPVECNKHTFALPAFTKSGLFPTHAESFSVISVITSA